MKAFCTMFFISTILISCTNDDNSNNVIEPTEFECSIENAEPKGERKVGIDLLNVTETGPFENNIDIAKDMGIEFLTLHTTWADIEPSPQNYVDPFDVLYLISSTAANNNFKLNLTVRPIDLTGKTVPADLNSTRFNDSLMTSRFTSMLDFVFGIVDKDLVLNLQIGNEIDGYNTGNEHPDFWSDYGAFLFEVKEYVHQNYPNIKVGYTATLHGLNNNPTLFSALNTAVDIMGVTYYPLKSNFDVEDPDIVFKDINDLIANYPTKPIYLQEIGYQSSQSNNSSEEKQAKFYCHFFEVWDNHKSSIKAVNFLRMNDLSLESAEMSAIPYGLTDTGFIEYLRTLGIRSYDGNGQNKPAFDVIKKNLEARNW